MKFVVQRRSTPIGSYTSSNAFLWNICDDGYQSQSLICAVRAHMCVTQWYDLLALRSPRVCGSETCNISIDILFSVQMKLKPYATHLNCVWRKRNGMGGQDLFFAFCRLFCEFNFLVFLFLNEKKKRKLVGSRHTLQCPRESVAHKATIAVPNAIFGCNFDESAMTTYAHIASGACACDGSYNRQRNNLFTTESFGSVSAVWARCVCVHHRRRCRGWLTVKNQCDARTPKKPCGVKACVKMSSTIRWKNLVTTFKATTSAHSVGIDRTQSTIRLF